ncbi:MAG: SCO family protein [Betaproteobacteria bacterium]|nr:SCO family protein [Betaproteobacteria bacterium]
MKLLLPSVLVACLAWTVSAWASEPSAQGLDPRPPAQPQGSGGLDYSASPIDPQMALAVSQRVIGKAVGDYVLTDRAGNKAPLSRYRGKPLLVSFVYTGCYQVCPAATKFLSRAVKVAQDTLGPGSFATVTIGFNLPFDTPQAMASFAKQQGIALPNWEFLSPEAASLDQLTKDFGFSYAATPKGFDHVTQVTLVDGEGRVYRQIYGDAFEIPMLVGPLKDLVTGAPSPAPTLSDLVEKLRLLCTVYDPASGRYRLNYALFIEIFAGLTVIGAVVYSLLHEWRRHRNANRA